MAVGRVGVVGGSVRTGSRLIRAAVARSASAGLAGLVLLSAVPQVRAANFNVTDSASFVAAVAGAGNGDTINILNSFTMTTRVDPITANVTVIGNGNTIDANNAFRPFFVYSGTVAIQNLTVANGMAQGGNGAMPTWEAAVGWAPGARSLSTPAPASPSPMSAFTTIGRLAAPAEVIQVSRLAVAAAEGAAVSVGMAASRQGPQLPAAGVAVCSGREARQGMEAAAAAAAAVAFSLEAMGWADLVAAEAVQRDQVIQGS